MRETIPDAMQEMLKSMIDGGDGPTIQVGTGGDPNASQPDLIGDTARINLAPMFYHEVDNTATVSNLPARAPAVFDQDLTNTILNAAGTESDVTKEPIADTQPVPAVTYTDP